MVGSTSTALGELFPRDAECFTRNAEEMAASRLWAGIHFRSDNEAGLALGRAVAQAVLERARAPAPPEHGRAAGAPARPGERVAGGQAPGRRPRRWSAARTVTPTQKTFQATIRMPATATRVWSMIGSYLTSAPAIRM